MSDDTVSRIEELAWRNHARASRPGVLKMLPEAPFAPVSFLEFAETRAHSRAFSSAIAQAPSETVRDLEECWVRLAALWLDDDLVIVLPDLDDVGGLVMPFRYLSQHRDFLLRRGRGALYVADPTLLRGFSYLEGETDRELRKWPSDNRVAP